MKKNSANSSQFFWATAKEYIGRYLPGIRKSSDNTVSSYRQALNNFIDYLEQQKHRARMDITFEDFNRESVKEYMGWMLNSKQLAPKTCNLRLTAIRALMEYAAQENFEMMANYIDTCSVKTIKAPSKPIEYLEKTEMAALLQAPAIEKKTERRNLMMLIFLYDTAVRVSEMLNVKIKDIHLDAETPFVTILGKGRKYRNIPLMEKTQKHLKRYLDEFHVLTTRDVPLFYATTHGENHCLSTDTVEKMLKRYASKCTSNGVEMPQNIYCHMIRKTRAMDLYQHGIPLTHIQQLLGHENMSTTSGFYAFATIDTLAKSLEKANVSQEAINWKSGTAVSKLYSL